MRITAAERVLLHLHGFWNAREPVEEMTQAGISKGAQILRSHVPRTLHALTRDGLVETKDARLLGRSRKTRVYRLTAAGVRRARELLTALDASSVDVDGRRTTLGEARHALALTPVAALSAVDSEGRLVPPTSEGSTESLLQREEDLANLRRWFAGPSPISVVYGSRGMGKTALGKAFVQAVPNSLWIDLDDCPDLPTLVETVGRLAGQTSETRRDPLDAARWLLETFDRGTRLLILDGYGEVPEGIVELLSALARLARGSSSAKLLVLAQETTPAYCRFYGRGEIESGIVVERHLKGLDLEGCRAMLANPGIDEEALRRIYLLTRGCPLYLRYIRDGDDAGLRAHSRFTTAEIRLLLYSGGARSPSALAS